MAECQTLANGLGSHLLVASLRKHPSLRLKMMFIVTNDALEIIIVLFRNTH